MKDKTLPFVVKERVADKWKNQYYHSLKAAKIRIYKLHYRGRKGLLMLNAQ